MRALINVPKRPKFALPIFECGDYINELTKARYSFRFIPRAAKFPGHFGLYFHDADAGKILIAAILPGRHLENTYIHVLKDYTIPDLGKLVNTRPSCCWCGKDLKGEVLIHERCKKKSGMLD